MDGEGDFNDHTLAEDKVPNLWLNYSAINMNRSKVKSELKARRLIVVCFIYTRKMRSRRRDKVHTLI